jgi:hypothetical protein
MADSLTDKKVKRFKFLHALYDKTGGNRFAHPNMSDIAEESGISREDAELVVQYLHGEHLLEFASLGGYISITHHGIVEVERALSAPELPTHYFPPVVNIVNVTNMSGSSIQQAGANSHLSTTLSAEEAGALSALVTELHKTVGSLAESGASIPLLSANVATLEAQASAPKPNATIVREALKTVRNVLEGTGGSLVATGVLHEIVKLLGRL